MTENEDIQKLLKDEQYLNKLISYKREEETKRIGGIDKDLKIKDFLYFKLEQIKEVESGLRLMQDKYVLEGSYKININKVKNVLTNIHEVIKQIEVF